MKERKYIIQGMIKDKGKKQENIGMTACEALRKGNATIDKPIYCKATAYRVFTNNIDESLVFDSLSNAYWLTNALKTLYLDFDFRVIECEVMRKICPIGT